MRFYVNRAHDVVYILKKRSDDQYWLPRVHQNITRTSFRLQSLYLRSCSTFRHFSEFSAPRPTMWRYKISDVLVIVSTTIQMRHNTRRNHTWCFICCWMCLPNFKEHVKITAVKWIFGFIFLIVWFTQ